MKKRLTIGRTECRVLDEGGCHEHASHFIRASEYLPYVENGVLYYYMTKSCKKGCYFHSHVELIDSFLVIKVKYKFSSRYAWGDGVWYFNMETGKKINTNNPRVKAYEVFTKLRGDMNG